MSISMLISNLKSEDGEEDILLRGAGWYQQ